MAGQVEEAKDLFDIPNYPIEVDIRVSRWLPLLYSMMATDADRQFLRNSLMPAVRWFTIQHSCIFFSTKNDDVYVYFSKRPYVYAPHSSIPPGTEVQASKLSVCNEFKLIEELSGIGVSKIGSTEDKIFALSAINYGTMLVWGIDYRIVTRRIVHESVNGDVVEFRVQFEIRYDSLCPRKLGLKALPDMPVLDFAVSRRRLILLHVCKQMTMLDVDTMIETPISLVQLNSSFGYSPFRMFTHDDITNISATTAIMSLAWTSKELKKYKPEDEKIVQMDVLRAYRVQVNAVIKSVIVMLTDYGQVYFYCGGRFSRLVFDSKIEGSWINAPSVNIVRFFIDRIHRRLLLEAEDGRLFEYTHSTNRLVSIDNSSVRSPGDWLLHAAKTTQPSAGHIYFDQLLVPLPELTEEQPELERRLPTEPGVELVGPLTLLPIGLPMAYFKLRMFQYLVGTFTNKIFDLKKLINNRDLDIYAKLLDVTKLHHTSSLKASMVEVMLRTIDKNNGTSMLELIKVYNLPLLNLYKAIQSTC